MSDDYSGIPFMGTDYEYKVSLGRVMDKKSLSWESHVYCKEWSDAERLVDAWNDSRDHPAVVVEPAFRPTDDHPNAI